MHNDAYRTFISRLESALRDDLPGREAQFRMANRSKVKRMQDINTPPDAGKASILILFYPSETSIRMVFIKRSEYDGVHSGQISFPGGRKEESDRDDVHTALRESHEEIGVPEENVKVLGKLTKLYIPPSNFLVTPVVGCVEARPDLIPDPDEVAEIIEVDLDVLLSEKIMKNTRIQVGAGFQITAPAFCPDGYVIWGATAMILNELLVIIRNYSLSPTS
jgi:8-oxo-dGTP pyrophosphatase MutT (NUDIX family)